MNIETRFANRIRSIFGAFGQIVNDFYLEIGIYFVGGLNASLVAWNIYTDLLADGQPTFFAIGVGVIALIAVEGLAVYLVGAAAKTRSKLLWFFSIVFAAFFTYAHIQETRHSGLIAQYITQAIPFFVVIGYWARTVKLDLEQTAQKQAELEQQAIEHQSKLEDEERLREQKIEDDIRLHKQEQERLADERDHELKMAKVAAKAVKIAESNTMSNSGVKDGDFDVIAPNLDGHNARKKLSKTERILQLEILLKEDENLTNAELARRLGVTRQTIINYKNSLQAETNGAV